MLEEAVRDGLRFLVVRAGDFFGPRAPSSWVSAVLLGGGKSLRKVVTPEQPKTGHSWAYLPDLAEVVAVLADREGSLETAERVHFEGHYLQGRGMAEAIRRVAGAALPIRPFSWLPVYLGAPFVTFLREVIEMRYLWRVPLRLDNARLRGTARERAEDPARCGRAGQPRRFAGAFRRGCRMRPQGTTAIPRSEPASVLPSA